MKTIDKILGWCVALLLLVPMASCSDDDDEDNGSDIQYRSLVGEWYSDFGVEMEGTKDWGISIMREDGTTSGFQAHVTRDMEYLIPIEGTYKISGKKYSQTISLLGETISSTLDIISIGMYDVILFNNAGEMMDISHRIVDTYNLQVGATREMLINDPDFVVMEYHSDNENVARISPNGTIEALRAGTAYVWAVSAKGTAVIRVVVTNPTTGIDDFMAYMLEHVDVATQAYGTLYGEIQNKDEGTIRQRYYMLDENVREVRFTYGESKVIEDIRILFRNGDLLDEIADKYFGLYNLKTQLDDVLFFQTKKNGRTVNIYIDYEINMVQFVVRDDDPIQALDDLVHMTATEAAAALGHTITDSERLSGQMTITIPDNPVFSDITIKFNSETDVIKTVYLYCNDGITVEDLEPWYQQNYIATGNESLPYAQVNPNIYVFFYVSDWNGKVTVVYML